MAEFGVEKVASLEGKECLGSGDCCSYVATGNRAVNQAIYVCHTCEGDAGLTTGECCCLGCMKVCHIDHDVEFIAYGDAYCDCGARGCALYERTFRTRSSGQGQSQELLMPPLPLYLQSRISSIRSESSVSVFEILLRRELILQEAKQVIRGSKETFWVTPLDPPRNALETLAQTIGNFHMKRIFKDDKQLEESLILSGFEWWIQIKSCNEGKKYVFKVD